ncbi:PQQ-like beta-propeller repeat protein [bacterium]|nr:PQQ-like beta-propeller repeat protein [bacterium]
MRRVAVTIITLTMTLGASCGLWDSTAGEADSAQSGGHFAIGKPDPQKGWAGDAIEPEKWKPVEQPNLAEELKSAPVLELENVAPPPERCWVGHQPYLVPNPDGKSWDMVFPYYNRYRGEQEVVIHDFGTGKTSKQVLSTRKGDSVLTREAIGFHMQPSYYTNGKLIFEMYGPVIFVVYDPAVDQFVHGTKPFGDEVINGRCVLGKDGVIYGMGWPRDKSGFVAYRLDPKTYEAKCFQTFGPPNKRRSELYRQVEMFGDWVYAGIGHQPWNLVAFNFKTREGRLLATSIPTERGHGIGLAKMKGGVSGHILNPASIHGFDDFDRKEFEFWLHEGKICRRESDIPPWSDAPAERDRSGTYRWAREFQQWGDFMPQTQPPGFKKDAGDPDARGHVALPYRLPGQKEWRTLEYDVKMYPGKVKLLTEVNGHVLFATDEGYGQHVFYDLKTNQIMRVGGTLSPYSCGVFRNGLYVSGYPSSQMYEYDFTRRIGLKQENLNPKLLGYLAKKNDTHCPLAGTMGGADGRVYTAGTTYGRRREGGGLGWYDTQTGEIGGMPFDGHRIFWMTSACEGRYILLSSKHGSDGQLFCWDTQKHAFIYKKTVLGGGRPGPIEEALPDGLVIGHHDRGVLYGFRADTGEVLWEKKVPAPPVTAFSRVRRHAYCFRRGPEGSIWSFFGDTLVRINPTDARIEAVGRTSPAQIAFAVGEVYIAGGDHLRRIALPSSAPRAERSAP